MVDWLAVISRDVGSEDGGILGAGLPVSAEALVAALLGGLLGALVAIGVSCLLRRVWVRLAGTAPGGSGRPSAKDLPCGDARCGLEEFSREVEARLDAKLDRLQGLLAEADRVLGRSLRTASSSGSRPASASPRPADCGNGDLLRGAPAIEGDPRPITEEERERVIALAADGATPESISDAVGLLRGEVDLILRLYGREA